MNYVFFVIFTNNYTAKAFNYRLKTIKTLLIFELNRDKKFIVYYNATTLVFKEFTGK